MLPDRHELRREGDVRRLQPRLIGLLSCLAEYAGQTCTREQLLNRVWSRKVLNDEVLSRSIADLRLALDDDARAPRYIETIPKLGYRLLAEVRPLDSAAAPVAALSNASAGPIPVVDVTARRKPVLALVGTVSGVLAAIAALLWWSWPTGDRRGALPVPLQALIRQVLAAQPMTSVAGMELRPRFATSAPWMAYSVAVDGGRQLHLWLRSRDGNTERQLTRGEVRDLCPLFADGDRTLYFQRHSAQRCEILRMPVVGGEPQQVTACALVGGCMDLSRDGHWLLYSAPPESGQHAAGIARWRLADGTIERLTRPTLADGDDLEPRASPWRDELVFQRGRTGETRLWRWQPGVNVSQQLSVPAGMYYGSAWLDASRLLVATDAGGFRALHQLDLESGAMSLVGGRGARFPQRAPDDALTWELANYDANLWLYDDAGAGRQLTRSLRYDAYPRLSPVGRQVAYQSNRDGTEQLFLLDLDSGVEQRLPLDPRLRWGHPAWQRDGQQLWLTAYTDRTTEIWTWRLGAARAHRMERFAPGGHDVIPDPIEPDRVWYLRGEGVAAELHTQRADGPSQRVAEGVVQFQVQDRHLYRVAADSDRLWRCGRTDPANCAALPIQLAVGQDRNWVVSDHSLWFAAPGQRTLSRYDLATGAVDSTALPLPGALSRAIDASADDRTLVIARLDALEVDLYWAEAPH